MATIRDLTLLGYWIKEHDGAVYVEGFGVNGLLGKRDTPELQAAVDKLADPASHANRKWQWEHGDELDAVISLTRTGYLVTGDPDADTFQIANRYSGEVVYRGDGAELPTFAAHVPLAFEPTGSPPPPAPVLGETTLPLTPTSGKA